MKSARQRYVPFVKLPPIPRRKLRTGKALPDVVPNLYALGLGSMGEYGVYVALKKHGIPFVTQQNFDGGASVSGGQRADFVLPDRDIILEVLGFFHDTPGQQLRDERKWENRRKEGWVIKTVRADSPDIERDTLNAVGNIVL